MARNKTLLTLGTLAVAAALALPGCNSTSYKQVHWMDNGQPAVYSAKTDEHSYTFVYHPSIQGYYEPYTGTYYSFDGTTWNETNETPRAFITDPMNTRFVTLATNRPHEQHSRVARKFGPMTGRYPQADELIPEVETVVIGDPSAGEKRFNHTFDLKGNLIREEIFYVDRPQVTNVDDIND